MRRKTFDILLTSGGLVVAIVLVVAGSLLLWGHNFANSNVRSQLAQQQITFPAKGSSALASSKIGPYLNQYAGQQLLDRSAGQGLRRSLHRRAPERHALQRCVLQGQRRFHGGPQQRRPASPRCRPCSRAPPCGGCCSRRTPSGRWARSPSSAPS